MTPLRLSSVTADAARRQRAIVTLLSFYSKGGDTSFTAAYSIRRQHVSNAATASSITSPTDPA